MSKQHLVFSALLVAVPALLCSCGEQTAAPGGPTITITGPATNAATPAAAAADTNMPAMEANQSVVVVKDLGFGRKPPMLDDVLRDLERRSQPEDGLGRTFAVIEAFTQSDLATSNLNICLRISSEKPGTGEVVFRRTGQSLWKSRITPETHKSGFAAGSLTILFEAGDGKSFTVDGSLNPPSILDAMLKEAGVPVAQAWPDGEVRDLAFIYSACGCPIHVKCRRTGDRTIRTEQATQVIFPDDPAAVQVISRLMRW
jgi:hypothetical protein